MCNQMCSFLSIPFDHAAAISFSQASSRQGWQNGPGLSSMMVLRNGSISQSSGLKAKAGPATLGWMHKFFLELSPSARISGARSPGPRKYLER